MNTKLYVIYQMVSFLTTLSDPVSRSWCFSKVNTSITEMVHSRDNTIIQESPAIADKPARRESLPKLLQFDMLTTLSLTNWPIFIRLAVAASEICEIQRNSLKIQTYEVQGHPRSSILVPIESPYVTCY